MRAPERRVVVDQQHLAPAARARSPPCLARRSRARRPPRTRSCHLSGASSSKAARRHRTVTRAPCARLANCSVAPVRASSVCAMNTPRPSPSLRSAGRDVGLAQQLEHLGRKARARRPRSAPPPRRRRGAPRCAPAARANLSALSIRLAKRVPELRRRNQLWLGAARAAMRSTATSSCDVRAADGSFGDGLSRAESGTRVNGAAPRCRRCWPSDLRISRQRWLWLTSSATSSASGLSSRHAVGELARGHRDGRERAAELVRGGRGEAAQRRQLLLARERHLRGRERVRQPARLVRDPPGVAGDQRGAQHQGEPQRRRHRAPAGGTCPSCQGRSLGNRASRVAAAITRSAEHDRGAQRQGGRRQRHRHDQQDRERVLQPTGQRQAETPAAGCRSRAARLRCARSDAWSRRSRKDRPRLISADSPTAREQRPRAAAGTRGRSAPARS